MPYLGAFSRVRNAIQHKFRGEFERAREPLCVVPRIFLVDAAGANHERDCIVAVHED